MWEKWGAKLYDVTDEFEVLLFHLHDVFCYRVASDKVNLSVDRLYPQPYPTPQTSTILSLRRPCLSSLYDEITNETKRTRFRGNVQIGPE